MVVFIQLINGAKVYVSLESLMKLCPFVVVLHKEKGMATLEMEAFVIRLNRVTFTCRLRLAQVNSKLSLISMLHKYVIVYDEKIL